MPFFSIPKCNIKITAPRRAYELGRSFVTSGGELKTLLYISLSPLPVGGKACLEARAIVLEISDVTQNKLRYRRIGLGGLGLRVAYVK